MIKDKLLPNLQDGFLSFEGKCCSQQNCCQECFPSIIFPHVGKGYDVMSSNVLESFGVLADFISNVGLLLVELIVVLMLGTTIVVTDVMSLGTNMLCGSLLNFGSWCYRTNVYVTGVKSLQPRCYEADVIHVVKNHSVCDRCYVTQALMLFGLLLEPKIKVNSLVPHPIYVAVGICLYFCFFSISASLMDLAKL